METYVTDRTHVWNFLLWIWPFKSDLLLQVSNICTELQINTNFTRQNYTQQSDINRRGAIFLYHISLHLGISPIHSISSISLITTYGCCTLTIFKYQEKQYIYIYCLVSWTEFIIFFNLDFPVEEIKRKSSKQAATWHHSFYKIQFLF